MRIQVIVLVVLDLAPCVGAVTHGEIKGTVTSGRSPLAGERVVLDGRLEAWTNESGVFVLPIVSPGIHRLTAGAVGFGLVEIDGVGVQAGTVTELRFPIGNRVDLVPEEFTTTSDAFGHVFRGGTTVMETEELSRLPATSVAEAVMATPGSFAGTLRNGTLLSQQTFLDGGVITGTRANVGHEPSINPYMIQQLAVRAGVYEPSYRDGSSGILELTTPEGGERFSGSLAYRTLAAKGLRWTSPPPLDLRTLINTALTLTDAFNAASERSLGGLSLRPPFDVLDTASADPFNWTARYIRDNFYWDYDRIIPEAEAPGFSYVTQGLPLALAQSGRIDRRFQPEKYAG